MANFASDRGIIPQKSEVPQVQPRVNLFDFTQKSTVQPQATNFVNNIKPVAKQPIQQPTPKSRFSIIPKVNADSNEQQDLLQIYLSDPKQDNNSKQQLFKAIQD